MASRLFCRRTNKSLRVKWTHKPEEQKFLPHSHWGVPPRLLQTKSIKLTRAKEVSGAHFLDLFLPLNGVNFLDHRSFEERDLRLAVFTTKNKEDFSYKGTDISPFIRDPLNLKEEFVNSYKDLTPINKIQNRVEVLRRELGPFIAIHIRRTDHKTWLEEMGIDHDPYLKFEDFIDEHSFGKKVFLATDNASTQRHFKNKYRDLVTFNRRIIDQGEMAARNTSAEDAVVDLYTCAHASSFLGTNMSSFSSLIEHLSKAVGT